jgi:hypothetical protein
MLSTVDRTSRVESPFMRAKWLFVASNQNARVRRAYLKDQRWSR